MRMTNGLITLSISRVVRKVAKGNALYDILDTLMEMVTVVSVDRNVIADSVALRANDFEDAIQYYSAKKISADYIVTNNIKDFDFSDIDVVKPIDFLRK